METLIKGLVFLFVAFAGFALGRIGDKYGGHLNAPHHWVYGLASILVGVIYFSNLKNALLFFGVGLFVSDLEDFFNFRLKGPDKNHEWRFWSIN